MIQTAVQLDSFLESLKGVLKGALCGGSLVLLGDFNFHDGRKSETWRGVIGRNSFPNMNKSGVWLFGLLYSSQNEHHVQA